MHITVLYVIIPVVMKTCAFTGNRPDKLPWGYDETDSRCLSASEQILGEIFRAAEEGFGRFVCGMAQGGDTLFAEAVLFAKKTHNIILECAVPFKNQCAHWNELSVRRYNKIIASADEVNVLSDKYTPWCMHARNRYMVDRADRIIALNYADSGGTKYTLEYALRKNKEIICLV